MNRYLTLLGYENTNNDKKERMITGEISSNYGEVEAMRNSSLVARQNAVNEINEKFGLDIKVRFRSDVDTLVNLGEDFNEDYENSIPTFVTDQMKLYTYSINGKTDNVILPGYKPHDKPVNVQKDGDNE